MFGTNGNRTFNIVNGEDYAIRHALLPDGKLLLGGGGYDIGCNCYHISLAKMDTLCGKPDATFGNSGNVAQILWGRSTLSDMAVLPDGRILACGQVAPDNSWSQHVCGIYRFNADGTPDNTFDGDGWRGIRFDATSSGAFLSVIPLEDGRFYAVGVSGSNINGGAAGAGVMRFLEDGSLDPTWSGDGILWTPGALRTSDAVMLPDSSVVWIGHDANADFSALLIRFGPDGTITSVPTGLATLNDGNHRHRTRSLPDGRFLLSGYDNSGNAFVARFLTDLSLDATYGTDGVSTIAVGAALAVGGSIDLLADGGTVQFGTAASNGPSHAIRRDADGSLVNSFGTGGLVTIPAVADQQIRGGVMLSSARMIAYGRGWQGEECVATMKMTTDPTEGLFADLGPDTGFCLGGSVLLDAGFPGNTYQWNFGNQNLGTTQGITANMAGSYRVAITDAMGCTDRDTVVVTGYYPPDIPEIEYVFGELWSTAQYQIQWYLNGEPIPDATSWTWVPQANGSYTVTDTEPFAGCSSTSEPYLFSTLGVEADLPSSFSLTVMPNPVMDVFRLEGLPNASARIELHTADGRLAHHEWSVPDQPKNLAQLTPGTYSITVHNKEGQLLGRGRIVKL